MKLTAQQKNNSDNMANTIEKFNQPDARRIQRNKITIGTVMRMNVTMTSFVEGSLLCRAAFADAA
jgi:hypothetical protein